MTLGSRETGIAGRLYALMIPGSWTGKKSVNQRVWSERLALRVFSTTFGRPSGRSAAWLAHQTGGLGVGGSNPLAPLLTAHSLVQKGTTKMRQWVQPNLTVPRVDQAGWGRRGSATVTHPPRGGGTARRRWRPAVEGRRCRGPHGAHRRPPRALKLTTKPAVQRGELRRAWLSAFRDFALRRRRERIVLSVVDERERLTRSRHGMALKVSSTVCIAHAEGDRGRCARRRVDDAVWQDARRPRRGRFDEEVGRARQESVVPVDQAGARKRRP